MAYTSNSMIASMSLAASVEQAVNFLVTPLTKSYRTMVIVDLSSKLTTALYNHCERTWDITNPRSGSGRRCLSFTPGSALPRVVYQAAQAARVDPDLWVQILTLGSGFYLYIDPGCVSVSDPATDRARPIWSAELRAPAPQTKTFAQLIDAQESGDDVLALCGSELPDSPQQFTGFNHILSAFPAPPTQAAYPARPDSRASTHSRSSSFSSLSSASGASFSSVGSDDSASTASSSQSRRERARVSKVFIDSNKKEVTPYDGGKTTVLTGGVMLGAKPTTPKASATTFASAASWRRC
jgi:protein Tob/BTG